MQNQLEVIQYRNFGECIRISNAVCTVVITVDVGPRIIYYGMNNGINLFREDISRQSYECGEAFDRFYYQGAVWYHYGGHRLWFTPEQSPDTYYPDNHKVSWSIEGNVLILVTRKQIKNEVKYIFKIELDCEGTDLRVGHEIRNCSARPRLLAPWTVTQMAPAGNMIIPLPQFEPESMAPRQKLQLWDNTSITDPRFHWRKDSLWVKHNPEEKDRIKLGVYNTGGKAFYYKEGYLFTVRFPFAEGKKYPDGGASFEMYCCSQFCEMETLGEEVCLLPGEQAFHEISFSLDKLTGNNNQLFEVLGINH